MLKQVEKSANNWITLNLPCYLYIALFIHCKKKRRRREHMLNISDKQKQCSSTIQALNFRSHQTKVVELIIFKFSILRESLKHSIQENFITSFTSLLKNLILILYIYYRFSFLLL